jgi:hypothetical protein
MLDDHARRTRVRSPMASCNLPPKPACRAGRANKDCQYGRFITI